MPNYHSLTDPVTKKYWVSDRGRIYFVPVNHESSAIEIARELGWIKENESIQDRGFEYAWDIGRRMLSKGFIRIQIYGNDSKEIGLNSTLSTLKSRIAEKATFTILPKVKEVWFEEYPFKEDSKGFAEIKTYRKLGWRRFVSFAFESRRKNNV